MPNLSRDNLHKYQLRAVNYIKDNDYFAIHFPMGLGKTAPTLTAIRDLYDDFAIGKVLVIAPLRVCTSVWPAEIKKWWHLCDFSISQLAGLQAKQRKLALLYNKDITIINRELIPWLVNEWGQDWPYDMVVIDESSSFKNQASMRFKALKKVRGRIRRMVLLTGTPAPNGLLDLWAPMWLLDMGRALGRTVTKYRQTYFNQDYMGWSWELRDGSAEKIHEKIKHLCVAVDRKELGGQCDVVYTDVPVYLPKKVRGQYEELRREMIVQLKSQTDTLTAMSAAAVAMKCMQFADGTVYTPDTPKGLQVHKEKINALQEIVDSAEGASILVAYRFKSDLEHITKTFKNAKILDKNPETVEQWNAGKIPMLLLHPASGGHGLNLQHGGHIIVWYGLPWPPALELYEQLNARLNRQGQTETVFIYRIIAKDTVDESVMDIIEGKQDIQDALLSAVEENN